MGNQNVKPAKRPAQVYPFNDTDKKSRTDWTAGKGVAIPDSIPDRVSSFSFHYLNFLDHFTISIISAHTKFLTKYFQTLEFNPVPPPRLAQRRDQGLYKNVLIYARHPGVPVFTKICLAC